MGEGTQRAAQAVEFSFTSDQLAALWQVHRKTIIRRCESGDLPGAWLDDSGWRIPASAAVRYQQARTIKAPRLEAVA